MTALEAANTPAILTIAGVDSGGAPTSRKLPLCRSLPTDVAIALDQDLITIGRRGRMPYDVLRPQLDAIEREAKAAAEAKDRDRAAQLMSDRNRLLDRLHDSILSGAANELTANEAWDLGRRSVDGLVREIGERLRLIGQTEITEAELRVMITPVNAGQILQLLREALEDAKDPSAGT